ncbi:WD40 repeat-like protein [Coprinopsis marcescibilis]|uniref:WD40 repeat-like protein n=1 Tax=Coprinopsis marcescibilis TaxID=230819 RepID=A0A5C3KRY0_COPMA|nr:WD40 repeat-like protein [Coprinopsis marcescibilis]
MLPFIQIRTFLKRFSLFSFSSSYRLVGRLTGHQSQITQLAFTDDGEVLASGSSDETVKIWNVSNLKLIHDLRDKDSGWGQTSVVKWFESSQTSRFLFIGTRRGQLIIYRYTNGTVRPLTSENLFRTTAIEDLDFDSSTRCLVVCDSYGEVRAYTADASFKLKFLWKYEAPGNYIICRLHFNSGDVMAYVLHTGQRRVNSATIRFTIKASTGAHKAERCVPTPFGGVTLSPDRSLTLVDNLNKGFDLYTSATLSKKLSFLLPGKLNKAKDAVFVENGLSVACPAPYGAVYIYGLSSSSPTEILRHDDVRIVAAQSYPSKHLLASGAGACKFDICIWQKKIPQDGRSTFTVFRLFSFQGLFNALVMFTMFSMMLTQWPGAMKQVMDTIDSNLPDFSRHGASISSPTTVIYVSTVTATATSVRTVVPSVYVPTLTDSRQPQLTEIPEQFSPLPDGYFDQSKDSGEDSVSSSDSSDSLILSFDSSDSLHHSEL